MTLGDGAWLCPVFLLVLNMAAISCGAEKRNTFFYIVQETGKEEEFGLWYSVPSLLSCSLLCVSYSDTNTTQCVGVQFEQHTVTCRLLSSNVNWTPSTSLIGDNPLYRIDGPCLEADGFQLVNVSGSEICLSLFQVRVNYMDARFRCLDKGAHLLHLDTEIKFQATLAVLGNSGESTWIGINDLEVEGHWAYDLTGQNLTSYADGLWLEGEPNNHVHPGPGFEGEDCAQLRRMSQVWTLNDQPCSHPFPYICEIV